MSRGAKLAPAIFYFEGDLVDRAENIERVVLRALGADWIEVRDVAPPDDLFPIY